MPAVTRPNFSIFSTQTDCGPKIEFSETTRLAGSIGDTLVYLPWKFQPKRTSRFRDKFWACDLPRQRKPEATCWTNFLTWWFCEFWELWPLTQTIVKLRRRAFEWRHFQDQKVTDAQTSAGQTFLWPNFTIMKITDENEFSGTCCAAGSFLGVRVEVPWKFEPNRTSRFRDLLGHFTGEFRIMIYIWRRR